jgi:3-hydroxyacyl-CoA dehydrogenase/enoyl-CoA hydratase/3-hydroxybutyryl-CoA epimerase/3-hydroxyacyl-CoA dehydrogenase/enoyl-CoA hydratase/3-hydroxybutyryl-CoA epimerase/enoyl-CoA isomerase
MAAVSLSMLEPDVALLTFDLPDKSANVLSAAVLGELSEQLDALAERADLQGLILASGKPGTFIAGADLREFVASLDLPAAEVEQLCHRGQQLFTRLSQTPFLTVAAIDGVCLGGGAELASWCDRRVVSHQPKTEIGFPEVKLGLIPGWGGTARLPRLIGLGNAVEMITGGESVDVETARALGLTDDVVSAEHLLDAALRMVRAERQSGDYLRDRERWSGPISISETELGFLGVTASAMIRSQTKGRYPAPDAALEVMLEGAGLDVEQACRVEAKALAGLFGSPVNRALLNVFFLTDRNKKDRGIEAAQLQPREVRRVGVIGAGIMGYSIAAANLRRGMPVAITDASSAALHEGMRKALDEAAYDKKLKGPDPQRIAEIAAGFNMATVDAELDGCDVLIEAVVEKAEVKREIFARLEPRLAPDAILASNTSTIPITRLAQDLAQPERFCGIHFFNPVRKMKLVEVIRGARTDDQTVATAVAYAKRIGKMPIVVNDGPGFLVNRLLFPYMHEALLLLCEGADMDEIERAAKSFGMPLGPLELYDMVGIDTAALAGRVMWEAFPERVVPSPVLGAMARTGRLGQKSGRGFFSYQNKRRRPEPDPTFPRFFDVYIDQRTTFSRDELTNRLFMPMLLEATRVLEENIARDPRDIDLGMIFGLGFPPYKGGLMFWADTLGPNEILRRLEPLESIGARGRPTQMLLDMARHGGKFYP